LRSTRLDGKFNLNYTVSKPINKQGILLKIGIVYMANQPQFFGTDGIRGRVGTFPITADFVLKLGWAVGSAIAAAKGSGTILLGKDTRTSGYMFESALEAGITASGVNIGLLGPMPTPAVAYLTRALQANTGIVISASHNSFDNNGIKFFSTEGYKLSREMELDIEAWLDKPMQTAQANSLGKAWRVEGAVGRYIEFCKSSIPHNTSFKGFKIVLDCANGATYRVAPSIFQELGAQVIVMHATPNGLNINENCGTNHPEILSQRVCEEKADLGIAFDGDGDRVIMVDHKGEILDGDELLYIIVKGMLAANRLVGGIVGTHMSNMGLDIALQNIGVPFVRVPVGEQYVIAELIKNDWVVGGESSGHIIDRRVTTSDDGIIAALQVLYSLQIANINLHDAKQGLIKFPQKLVNVKCNGHAIDLNQSVITKAVKDAESQLGPHGRVLLRKSGTEPVIRIMVEGEDAVLVDKLVNNLKIEVETAVNH
jgi:phosphoglucosamine mutase